MPTFEQLLQSSQSNLNQASKKSREWFEKQARLLNKPDVRPMQIIKGVPEHNRANIVPGEMYLFQYDAKHRDKLPMWDMFPLVFPFKALSDGFIGLNLHYLSIPMRVKLLDGLMKFKSHTHLTENTRLQFSWQLIRGASQVQMAKQSVHRYLSSHVESPFKKIDPRHWGTAMMLPVERFVTRQ